MHTNNIEMPWVVFKENSRCVNSQYLDDPLKGFVFVIII